MRVLTLAAGVAAGYVLGTRAGRQRYEQIVAGARRLASHPTVVQAQERAVGAVGAGTDAPAKPARRRSSPSTSN